MGKEGWAGSRHHECNRCGEFLHDHNKKLAGAEDGLNRYEFVCDDEEPAVTPEEGTILRNLRSDS